VSNFIYILYAEYIIYTGCAKKIYPLSFSDNFSETAESFKTKFYTPIIHLDLR